MNTMTQTPGKAMNRDEIMLSLRRFREKYHAKYSIVKIRIWGSAARDNMNDRSDIDVVVDLVFIDCNNHLIGNKPYLGFSSYVHSVKWSDFKEDINKYINIAMRINEDIDNYNITKEIK